MNPTYRPNQRPPQPVVPSASVQSFPPLNQSLPVGLIDASASGSVPAFLVGSLDWLVACLRQIMSPEDFEKYKSSYDPAPQKEEVPLALQLANKTKERGSVLAQIERERVLVGDLKAKYEKHTETLTQLMERKYSLQREIEELEALSAAAEAKQQAVPVEPLAPGPPQGPQPVGPRDVFPGPPPLIEEVPQDEEGDDEAMEPGDLIPGAGVGFIKPTKRKLAKATAVKRVLGKGVFSKGRRSSLIVKVASLSTQDLVLLQEQVTELSRMRFRMSPNKNLIFRLLNLNRVLLWGSVFRGEGSGNEDNFLNADCCAGLRFQAGKVPPLSPALSFAMRSAAHCFSGHPVFDDTARQTADKFNVSLVCLDNISSGALLASSAVPGIQLRARRGLRQNSADERLVEQDALLCDGSSGAMLSRCVPQCGQREGHDSNAVAAAGVSGAHQVASFAGGEGSAAACAYGLPSGALPLRADHGVSPAAAGVPGLMREHSALQVASSARRPVAERAQLGGAGALRLRPQARCRCFDFGGLSDLCRHLDLVICSILLVLLIHLLVT